MNTLIIFALAIGANIGLSIVLAWGLYKAYLKLK